MTSDEIITQQKKLSAMHKSLTQTVYLTVRQVMEILNVSDDVVKGIPYEILPFLNLTPGSPRAHRRYHPDDVSLALRVLWPRYQEESSHGRGAAYLKRLREERRKFEDAMLTQSKEKAA